MVYEAIHIPSNERYIGETGGTLEARFQRHIDESQRAEAGRTGLSNRLDHDPDLLNYLIFPIDTVHDQKARKAREQFLINSKKPSLNTSTFVIAGRRKVGRLPKRLRQGRAEFTQDEDEGQPVLVVETKNEAFLKRLLDTSSKKKREELLSGLNLRRAIQIAAISLSSEIKELVQKRIELEARRAPSLMLDVLHPVFTKPLLLEAIRRAETPKDFPWKKQFVVRMRLARTFATYAVNAPEVSNSLAESVCTCQSFHAGLQRWDNHIACSAVDFMQQLGYGELESLFRAGGKFRLKIQPQEGTSPS